MFWFLSRYSCAWTVTGCQRGVLDSSGNVLSSLDQEGSADTYQGSYCAEETGTHQLLMTGRQLNRLEKFGSVLAAELNLGYTARCLDSDSTATGSVDLVKNKCYSFLAEAWYKCMGIGIKLEIKRPSADSYEVIGESNSIACANYDDCIDNYYMGNCSFYTDAYCNERGTINDGISGDGYCTCDSDLGSYLEDRSGLYCETESDKYFDQNSVWNAYSQDFNKIFETGGYIEENPFNFFDYAYVGIKIEGKVFIPQNGDYDFRAIGTSSVKLAINGNVVESTTISNYECSEPVEDVGSVVSFTSLIRGEYSFSMEIKKGCQLYNGYVGLQWKRYPYYRNNRNEAVWEYVALRFLGA